MAIDLSAVNWLFVALMGVFAFVAALLGSLISFRNRLGGALIAGILFAAIYVDVELLSASADPAADRHRLCLSRRQLTFPAVRLCVRWVSK